MDIQTKLIFTIEVYGSNNQVVKSFVQYRDINEELFPKGDLGNDLVEFGEYDVVKVTLQSQDSEAKLYIENFQEEIQVVKNGETINLTSRENYQFMLVPDCYMLKLKVVNREYKGNYKINPKSIDWNGLEKIKEYLENLVKGLSYNLKEQRTTPRNYSLKSEEDYLELIKSYREVIFSLDSIIKNPIVNLKNSYKKSIVSEKSDALTERWANRKGLACTSEDRHYSKEKVLDLNNKENRWIKKLVLESVNNLKQLQEEIKNSFLPSKDKYLKEIKYIKAHMINYEKRSFLRDISYWEMENKPSLTLLKDRRYYKCYKFYRKLRGKEEKASISYNFKKTSKLFEYYILALVIEMIQNEGYIWRDGWLADKDLLKDHGVDLEDNTILNFVKDDLRIEVAYDYEIQDLDYENLKSSFVPMNTRHRKPDIRITLFHKEHFIKSMIIEVKCRKQRYLFNKDEETDVMRQLKDYKAFGYYEYSKSILGEVKDKVYWNAIDNVIVAYPKQDDNEDSYSDPIYKFSFVQVDPAAEREHIEGYREIKNNLRDILRYKE